MRCPSSPPSYQSGIGVRAIRMTARIAPTNAAAPTTANTFLSSFFFAALPISAAQAMQTAAATSSMPSVSHSQDSSYRIFMGYTGFSPVRLHTLGWAHNWNLCQCELNLIKFICYCVLSPCLLKTYSTIESLSIYIILKNPQRRGIRTLAYCV